jgi:hypothetical protein
LNFLKFDNGTTLKTLVTLDGTQTLTNKIFDGGTASTTRRLTLPQTSDTFGFTNYAGTLIYLNSTFTPVIDTGVAFVPIATADNTLEIINKDINGGAASNSRRITIPKGTTTNLNALTRKEGTLVYDTTMKVPKFDDGTSLNTFGGSSANNLVLNPDFENSVSDIVSPVFAISTVTGTGILKGNKSLLITKNQSSANSYVEFTLRSNNTYQEKKALTATLILKMVPTGTLTGFEWKVGFYRSGTWVEYEIINEANLTIPGSLPSYYEIILQTPESFYTSNTKLRLESVGSTTPGADITIDSIVVNELEPLSFVSEDSYRTNGYGDSFNGNEYIRHANSDKFSSILRKVHFKNRNSLAYPGTMAMPANSPESYFGGALVPTLNRIYFSPGTNADTRDWLYLNCETGAIVQYASGATVVGADPYAGAVYSPKQNRVYFVPYGQANQTNWHYVDCYTGNIVAYAHGATAVSNAYIGGVYHPVWDRIYLVPAAQANQTNWHYIDCATGNVVAYAHGATAVSYAYHGGVYSPSNDRIYFVPAGQSNQTNWHFVDAYGVNAYAHGLTLAAYAYAGGAYSPLNKRVYFSPNTRANQATFHYINTVSSPSIGTYTNTTIGGSRGYSGAVYHPILDRIYFIPSTSGMSLWHYVDCKNPGTVVTYTPNISNMANAGYSGGVYSPTTNKLYFVPRGQVSEAVTHYIGCSGSGSDLSPGLCATPTLVTGG